MGRLLGLPDNGLLAAALADLAPRPAIIDLVKRARAARVKTAALSNSWGAGKYDPYAGWGLDELFDAVVISDQVGLRKPAPAIYELTAAIACSWTTPRPTCRQPANLAWERFSSPALTVKSLKSRGCSASPDHAGQPPTP
jgi:hypothetical protein